MMIRVNFIINLLNTFLILIYCIFLNIGEVRIEFEFLLILLITISSIIKLFNWYNYKKIKKSSLNIYIDNIFHNDRFTKLCIFILSIVMPIYMIIQKDNLIVDMFVEKISFLIVFLFSIIGFLLEFYLLESRE